MQLEIVSRLSIKGLKFKLRFTRNLCIHLSWSYHRQSRQNKEQYYHLQKDEETYPKVEIWKGVEAYSLCPEFSGYIQVLVQL